MTPYCGYTATLEKLSSIDEKVPTFLGIERWLGRINPCTDSPPTSSTTNKLEGGLEYLEDLTQGSCTPKAAGDKGGVRAVEVRNRR